MKIILSHDVDHLYWDEHYFKDLYLLGSLYRNTKGFLSHKIDLKLYLKRLKFWGRIHQLPELIDFYKSYGIKADFFFGMQNALGLSYHYKSAERWILQLIDNGHHVGVHGIAFENKENIDIEYKRFKELSGLHKFGIRTHYLKLSEFSLELFAQQGYIYDSSIEKITLESKMNNMWEIPITIMDVSLVENAQLNQDIETWKSNTIKRLESAEVEQLSYFVINFHDLYFADTFPVMKEWYIWLIDLLKSENYQFITFEDAVDELNETAIKLLNLE